MKPHDRLSAAIRDAAARGGPALVAFMTAGFPSAPKFREHLLAVAAGADVVEIGVPFTSTKFKIGNKKILILVYL